jgi:hypothetical protein
VFAFDPGRLLAGKAMTDRTLNNRTTGLVVGLLFLLVSLPTPWIFMSNATFETFDHGPFSFLGGFPITITGLKGFLTIAGFRLPIWAVVLLGVLSLVFLVLNQRQITSLPGICCLLPGAVSTIYILTAVAVGVFSPDAHLNAGPVLALVGLGLGMTCGLPQVRKKIRSDAVA